MLRSTPATPPNLPRACAATRRGGHGRALEARGLRTAHGDAVWNFRLEPGERLLVQDPSGCGKTTMLETLAGLRAPASVQALAPSGTRLFAEDAWVFATTARDNLRVAAPSLDGATATAVLAAVGFNFPLDFPLANGADSLSSGQRRRLLLAPAPTSPPTPPTRCWTRSCTGRCPARSPGAPWAWGRTTRGDVQGIR